MLNLTNQCLTQGREDQQLPSSSFTVLLALTRRSMVHFKLILIHGVR